LSKVATASFEPLRVRVPSVPEALERAVVRALSLDPSARFPSVRDLGRALLPFASEAVRASWVGEFGDAAPRLVATLVGEPLPFVTASTPAASVQTSEPVRPRAVSWRRQAVLAGATLLAALALLLSRRDA